jgi:hypothetical protein
MPGDEPKEEARMELPRLDLSRFAAAGRLPAGSEQAVVFWLMNGGTIADAAEWFSLPQEIVTAIAAKWYPQIANASDALHKSAGVNDSIDRAVAMISKDIKAKQAHHDKSGIDIMTVGEAECLNREIDRLVSIKAQSQKSYDSAIGGITQEIARQKALERIEQGDIRDDYQYLRNQRAVADLLGDDPAASDLRKVYACDFRTMRTRSFANKAEAISEMHLTMRKLESRLEDHKPFRNRYIFSFTRRTARAEARRQAGFMGLTLGDQPEVGQECEEDDEDIQYQVGSRSIREIPSSDPIQDGQGGSPDE